MNSISWKKPLTWHLDFSSEERTELERVALMGIFAIFTGFCAQLAFITPWTPVPYTFQTFAVLLTGVFLKRNDAFRSGLIYLAMGALGAPVFAEGGAELFSGGTLIASGGYLLAFPFASAIVAEGLDRSRTQGFAAIMAQLICWFVAMIPVYLVGTLWLAEAYGVSISQALEWGVTPFLLWDALKIVLLAVVTTKVLSFGADDFAEDVPSDNE